MHIDSPESLLEPPLNIQHMQKQNKPAAGYDPTRTLRMFGYGLCFYGPYQVGVPYICPPFLAIEGRLGMDKMRITCQEELKENRHQNESTMQNAQQPEDGSCAIFSLVQVTIAFGHTQTVANLSEALLNRTIASRQQQRASQDVHGVAPQGWRLVVPSSNSSLPPASHARMYAGHGLC